MYSEPETTIALSRNLALGLPTFNGWRAHRRSTLSQSLLFTVFLIWKKEQPSFNNYSGLTLRYKHIPSAHQVNPFASATWLTFEWGPAHVDHLLAAQPW